MAGLKEIKRRLKSVKNTKKITYAMKLVSAAKLRKAQDAVANARAYTDELNGLLTQLKAETGTSSVAHPLLEVHAEVKNICFLVIGGQRGLCGGYNSNIHRRIEALRKQQLEAHPGANIDAIVFGKKPAEFLRRLKRPYRKAYEDLTENANMWPVEEVCRELDHLYRDHQYDEVWLIYTRFRSAISQTVVADKLLPLDTNLAASPTKQTHTEQAMSGLTLFEPSVSEVFQAIVPRILNSKVRQACLDAKASETASRMTAMDAATKNAGQLTRKLELTHNRLRQLVITSQLLDIVGGAEALKSE